MLETFVRFDLERLLSTWENRVEYNLSESGVHPMTLRELLGSDGALLALGDVALRYPQSNGTGELRERIAALYPGAHPENVLVTVGAIQANFAALVAFTEPGDRVAVMQPNYQQFRGLVQNLGRRLSTFSLQPERDWRLDLSGLTSAASPPTTFLAVVNPNNPTGRVLSQTERRAIVEAAAANDAWLLADEVYAGVERSTDVPTASFYGEYEKVLAVNSMSKSYGLPGLRIGWVVGPEFAIERLWAWQDYVTISATTLANALAAAALDPAVRTRILARSRSLARRGFEIVADWAARRDDVSVAAPDAAAICFVKYRRAMSSTELAMRLIETQSVLVAPGDLFGFDGYLRVGFGLPEAYLKEGLCRIGNLLDSLP